MTFSVVLAKKKLSTSQDHPSGALKTTLPILYREVSGFERFADDYGGNVDEILEATAAAYPTVTAMADEYKLNMAETLHFVAHLPDEFLARKGEYWRLAYGLLQDPFHFDSHLEQMQAALESARKD